MFFYIIFQNIQSFFPRCHKIHSSSSSLHPSIKSFQQAKVTHGIPTQNPKSIPFSLPKYIAPKCVAPIGITVNINKIIKNLFLLEYVLKKMLEYRFVPYQELEHEHHEFPRMYLQSQGSLNVS